MLDRPEFERWLAAADRTLESARAEAELGAHNWACFLAEQRAFADQLDPSLGVRAVVVFGSVARGDFNLWSDVDVLVVAERLPEHPVERQRALGRRPGGVEPVAWTPAEWARQRSKRNPIASEAVDAGVWLLGAPGHIDEGGRGSTGSGG